MTDRDDLDAFFYGRRIHAEIQRRIAGHLGTGSYDSAVLDSFKVIEERLRPLVQAPHEFGAALAQLAFHPSTGVLTDASAVPGEQEGLHLLFRGAFLSFRNPPAHRFVDIGRDQALNIIVFANLLLSIIDEAERSRNASSGRSSGTSVHIPQFRYGTPYGPLILDVDNDGQPEVVSRSEDRSRVIEISKEDDRILRPQTVEQPDDRFRLFNDAASVDIDGDGSNELVCFFEGATQGHALLLYKFRNGQYEIMKTDRSAPIDANEYAPWFIDSQITDVDNDGVLEVVSRPYHAIPSDLIPHGYVDPCGDSTPSGRIQYVWKWSGAEGHFQLASRSFFRSSKWE